MHIKVVGEAVYDLESFRDYYLILPGYLASVLYVKVGRGCNP